MAASAAQSVARQLGSLIVEEAKFLYGVEEKVKELQQELAWMQGFLEDVDTRQHHEELIRMWVSQVRDFAYKAEDVVEMYIHWVPRHGSNILWDTLKRYSCILASAWTIHQVGSEIDKLTQKILKLNTRLKSYGVDMRRVEDYSLQYANRIRDLRQTYSFTVDKDLIKRENDIKKIVDQLLGDNKVVGVVGMGGLGKTTLVREVLRDEGVKERFGSPVWVYISQQPQKRRILEEMLSALKKEENVAKLTDEELSRMLSQVLKERRCLMVLDDIWYQETWLLLKHAFSTIKESESTLLLTTRNEAVVRKVGPDAFIVRPNHLDADQSWKLFLMKAFPDDDSAQINIDAKKVKVGKRMLEHCDGLPMAIVSLGGALATKKTVDEWEAVEKNIGKYFTKATGKQDDDIGVTQVLELSYNDLPFYLKPCFLCFGNFPEDSEIPTDVLYQLWQAEGLVVQEPDPQNEAKSEGVSIYDIGEEYLKMLVTRCMVEVGQVYEKGRIKTCRMHDMMRELCLKKSKEEKFLEVFTGDDLQKPSVHLGRSHRVALHLGEVDLLVKSFFDARQEIALKPRSVVVIYGSLKTQFFGTWFSNMSQTFKLLRVLCLDGFMIEKLPKALGSCIHVRYLRVGLLWHSKVGSAVWKLGYLQTLDLQGSGTDIEIPNKLWKLKRLVHLYLPFVYKAPDKLRLSQARQMETLVNIDISHLHEEDMQKMTNLRMVSFCRVVSERLKLLLKSPMINSRLLEKPELSIQIDAELINEDPRILVSNSRVCIRELSIKGKVEQSLEHISFPNTIQTLEFADSELQGDTLQYLSIPELRGLGFRSDAVITGNKLVFSAGSFPKLQKLSLRWLPVSSEAIEVHGLTLPIGCKCFISCPSDKAVEVRNAVTRLHHYASVEISPI